jgi:hypothetical protein
MWWQRVMLHKKVKHFGRKNKELRHVHNVTDYRLTKQIVKFHPTEDEGRRVPSQEKAETETG